MRISVVVPTFGRPALLEETLRSLQEQTRQADEVIVVDDHGPVTAMLPAWCGPSFSIVRRAANGGQSAAINTGAAVATGDVLMFLDDDDLYTRDRLERTAAAFEARGGSIVLCWSAELGVADTGTGRRLNGVVHDEIFDLQTPSLGATAVERAQFLPLDESYQASADLEWWMRMSTLPVTTVPAVGHLVRRHDGIRVLNSADKRVRSSERLMAQYADYFDAHPRAHAYRHKRIGSRYEAAGDYRAAAARYRRSFRIKPSLRTGARFLRATAHLVQNRARGPRKEVP